MKLQCITPEQAGIFSEPMAENRKAQKALENYISNLHLFYLLCKMGDAYTKKIAGKKYLLEKKPDGSFGIRRIGKEL